MDGLRDLLDKGIIKPVKPIDIFDIGQVKSSVALKVLTACLIITFCATEPQNRRSVKCREVKAWAKPCSVCRRTAMCR